VLVLSGQPTVGSYGYDWVGNRLSPPASPNAMEYNAADQLTRYPGMYRYTYYPDGSLHAVTKDDGTTPVAYYTYSDADLLATAGPDVNTTWLTNTWDADNNRVSFTVNSNTHTLVYDITAGIPAVIKEDGVYYYREPNGALIARQDEETWRLYHFDEIGSTACLTTLDGTVTDRYTYDPWGNLLTHDIVTDGGTDQPYQYVGQLGYYTHWQVPEFGLLQLGVRFYDPEVGRFTQRDPADYGLSSYEYAGSQPIGYVDPSGEAPGGLMNPMDPWNWSNTYAQGSEKACKMFNCAWSMYANAVAEVTAAGWPGMHNGPGDALKHCVGSCKMVNHCPIGTAEFAGYGHEVKPVIAGCCVGGLIRSGTVIDESAMDLHNNALGRNWGEIIRRNPGKGWTCLEGCVRMLRDDPPHLETLPRARW